MVYLGQIGVLLFVLLLVLQDATFFAPKVFAADDRRVHARVDLRRRCGSSRGTQVLYVDPAESPAATSPESEARK